MPNEHLPQKRDATERKSSPAECHKVQEEPAPGSHMIAVDTALAMNEDYPAHVETEFEFDIDPEELKVPPPSRDSAEPASREALADQVHAFQIACLKYHDDVVEIEQYRE